MQVPDILFLTPSRDELLKLKLSVIRQKHMACVLRSCCLMGGVLSLWAPSAATTAWSLKSNSPITLQNCLKLQRGKSTRKGWNAAHGSMRTLGFPLPWLRQDAQNKQPVSLVVSHSIAGHQPDSPQERECWRRLRGEHLVYRPMHHVAWGRSGSGRPLAGTVSVFSYAEKSLELKLFF